MLQPFIPLAALALREPQEAARELMRMGVPRAALWPAFGLMVVLSVLVVFAGNLVSPPPDVVGASSSPLVVTILSAIAGAASVWAVWKVGLAMGGNGRFHDALLLTVFLQAIILVGQVAELIALVIFPFLAWGMSLGLLVLTFWLNLNFIAALHGFSSLWKSFGVLLIGSFGVALVLILGAGLAGIQIMGPV